MKNREQFQRQMEARFNEWTKKFDALVATASRRVAEGHIALQQHVGSLKHRRETLRNKIDRLAAATESQWDSAKRDLEDAWHALEAGAETVQKRLADRSHSESR